MGQFLQQGNQIFFETMIRVKNYDADLVIPSGAGEPYAGKTLQEVNECAEEAVVIAHTDVYKRQSMNCSHCGHGTKLSGIMIGSY